MSVKREVCKNGFGEIISDSTTGQACEEYEAEQAKIKAKEKEAAEKQAREEEREEKRNKSCKEAFGSFYYWDGEMCVRNEVEWERWRDKQNDRWDSR
jgi:hypothetical protein